MDFVLFDGILVIFLLVVVNMNLVIGFCIVVVLVWCGVFGVLF